MAKKSYAWYKCKDKEKSASIMVVFAGIGAWTQPVISTVQNKYFMEKTVIFNRCLASKVIDNV